MQLNPIIGDQDPIPLLNEGSENGIFSLCSAADTLWSGKSLTTTPPEARKWWLDLVFSLCHFLETWNACPFLKTIATSPFNSGVKTHFTQKACFVLSCFTTTILFWSFLDMSWPIIAFFSLDSITSVSLYPSFWVTWSLSKLFTRYFFYNT